MSNNKYIIDEDSLTGIADAVRDKLGNGEAITDEDAGYYPVSVKKLGYSQAMDSAGYSGPGNGYTSSNTIYARSISELVNICGIRPSYIKVTVKNTSGFSSNDIIYRCANSSINSSSSRVDGAGFANYIAILSIPNDIESCFIGYGGYYSTYSSQYVNRSIPAYDVVFLDSNQNEININEYSENYFTVDQWGTTKTFLTGTSLEKIPFSIDDIQDKITNYLKASSSFFKSKVLSEAPGYCVATSGWQPDSACRCDFFDVSQDNEVFVFSAGNRLRVTTWNDITAPTNNTRTSSNTLCQSVYTLDGKYNSGVIVQTGGKKYLGVQKTNENLNGVLCFVIPTTILQEVN